jgi:hypothetical protein
MLRNPGAYPVRAACPKCGRGIEGPRVVTFNEETRQLEPGPCMNCRAETFEDTRYRLTVQGWRCVLDSFGHLPARPVMDFEGAGYRDHDGTPFPCPEPEDRSGAFGRLFEGDVARYMWGPGATPCVVCGKWTHAAADCTDIPF